MKLTFRLTILLSLSLTSHSILSLHKSPPSPFPPPKATPSDLLSLLGPTAQSPKVNPTVAKQLTSCFRFLVPFSPIQMTPLPQSDRNPRISRPNRRAQDELVWWPPESVLELARLAVDSAGDPDVVHRALDPTVIPELNLYLEFLFELIAARGPEIGLTVSLNRYDLFHGHVFLANDTGRLGILFHAKEYPAYDKDVFPCYMGYCQTGSDVVYDDSMNLRNVLWLAPLPGNSSKAWLAPGVLVVLDAHPEGIIYRDLIPEYVKFARTIYEDDLGLVAVDVNYLNVGVEVPDRQIFIC